MKKNLCKIILLGAVWGMFEATVGYLLHLSGIKIGSMIWFPVAYFFAHKAYRYTGSFSAVMLTAVIASSLKLTNLFLPGRIDRVLNPAVSIVLEAFALVLVYNYVLKRQTENVTPLTIALTGFLWRGLYVCYLFAMPRAYFDISSLTATESFLEFLFVKNFINIAIISAGFFAAKLWHKQLDTVSARLRSAVSRKAVMHPATAAGALILAVAVQVAVG